VPQNKIIFIILENLTPARWSAAFTEKDTSHINPFLQCFSLLPCVQRNTREQLFGLIENIFLFAARSLIENFV